MHLRHPFGPDPAALPPMQAAIIATLVGALVLGALATFLCTSAAAADAPKGASHAATDPPAAPAEPSTAKAKPAAETTADLPRPDAKTARNIKRALAYLAAGRHGRTRAGTAASTADKLYFLDRAITSLRHGRRVTSMGESARQAAIRETITDELVGALADQSEIYLARSSLPQARKRIEEAHVLRPDDERVAALEARVVDALARGGCVCGERVRAFGGHGLEVRRSGGGTHMKHTATGAASTTSVVRR